MDSSVFGVVELLLIFGLALALAVLELIRVRRDIRRSNKKKTMRKP